MNIENQYTSHSDFERKYLAEKKKFEAIFYGSETALVLFKGPHFIIEMHNEKYQQIYHGRPLLGQPLTKVVPELMTSLFPEILKCVYETGEHFMSTEGTVRLYDYKTGKLVERYFDTTFSRLDFGDGEYRIMATPREVTDRVIARKKLEQSLRDLEQEKELREKFVSALTHDLRTPLAVVKIGAQILMRKANKPDAIKEIGDRIVHSMDRADRMIRDLLDVNRIKAGKPIPLSISNCQMDSILEYVHQDLREIFGERFQFINNTKGLTGHWDSMALQRIIENLASNAVKYGAKNKTVKVTVSEENRGVNIEVHNEGIPLSLEEQITLFGEYNRSESAQSSGQIGWGIGLTLVKALSEGLKGEVTVLSNKELGTIFKVYLPLDSRNQESDPGSKL